MAVKKRGRLKKRGVGTVSSDVAYANRLDRLFHVWFRWSRMRNQTLGWDLDREERNGSSVAFVFNCVTSGYTGRTSTRQTGHLESPHVECIVST